MLKPIPFVFFILLLIVSSRTPYSQTLPLKENIIDNNFNGPAGIYVEDVDNNGFRDIISAGYDAADICIWLNNGKNPITWLKETIESNFAGAIYVTAEDINGDSLIDIIAAGWDARQIVLWKNLGGSNPIKWEKIVIDNNSSGAHEVFVVDIDKDGDKDIVSASASNHRIALHINNGGDPIVWTTEVVSNDFSGARSVCAGDIDNDNDIDLVGAAYSGNEIAFWRNDGGQPIKWTKFSIANNYNGAHRVCLYDLEGDGDLDILAAAYILDQIAWFRNDGGNPVQWTKGIVATNFNGALIACPADIDLDGDVDVIATAQDISEIAWWENDGSNPINWTKSTIKSSFYGAWPLFITDIDNDSDQDIIAGAYQSDDIVWWENLIYKTDYSGEPNPLPDKFIMYQNYPNPFNPVTTIKYELPAASLVSLKIYDLLGKEVKVIINEYQSAGEKTAEWNGKNKLNQELNSGVYFYKLKAGENILTRKMLLIK